MRASTSIESPGSRLVVVSNRLPVRRVERRGRTEWKLSPGGLVNALRPILAEQGGAWIGWSGASGVHRPFFNQGIELHPVEISEQELEEFYTGFSNRTVWPLHHDCIRTPHFESRWWTPYVEVNRRYAEAALDVAEPEDLIWVHDYQLQLVPRFLRQRAPHARVGFFLHIPFPPVDLFAQLPWRREILDGLLGADVIGLQTESSARNFLRSVARFTRAEITDDSSLVVDGRRVAVGAFPISIDVTAFEQLAHDPKVRGLATRIRKQLDGRKILLGVDRMDYSKGILHRMRALERLLEDDPDLVERCAMVQVGVPTREGVPEYAELRREIEQIAGRINGRFGRLSGMPMHNFCRSLTPRSLAAYYLAADVMAVTPLRDGMNLVAKEFVATRVDKPAVLVLSEFAGAAHELHEALLVNPHDEERLAHSLRNALEMPPHVAEQRMAAMRARLQGRDVFDWAESFVRLLQRTERFPVQIPRPPQMMREMSVMPLSARAPVARHTR